MTNQLLHNDQGLRQYGQERYQDLRREADFERLARQTPGGGEAFPAELVRSLVPIGFVLTLIVGAAVAPT